VRDDGCVNLVNRRAQDEAQEVFEASVAPIPSFFLSLSKDEATGVQRFSANFLSLCLKRGLNRPFGAAMDELIDMFVARIVNLVCTTAPDDPALEQHGDLICDLAG
jgi:hypothetical protein